MIDFLQDERICRIRVDTFAPGSACPYCRHTTIVHPMAGNPGVQWCGLCELEVHLERLRSQ